MYTISQRTKMVKQPRGGYLSPKEFESTQLIDHYILSDKENIPSGIISLCVNYLTRFMMGETVKDAFYSPMVAALYLKQLLHAEKLLKQITGLDDTSIVAACKLCGYDLSLRTSQKMNKNNVLIQPDRKTIDNIRIMVVRSLRFFHENGPVLISGYTMDGGYTKTVFSGNGDFMTRDCLWDIKIISKEITNKHTLKILVCYLMGLHSQNKKFQDINQIGIYNPRKNKYYLYELEQMKDSLVRDVERDVICYTS